MKSRSGFRAFLHTRIGILTYTLIVACVAFHYGQTSAAAPATKIARPRTLT